MYLVYSSLIKDWIINKEYNIHLDLYQKSKSKFKSRLDLYLTDLKLGQGSERSSYKWIFYVEPQIKMNM